MYFLLYLKKKKILSSLSLLWLVHTLAYKVCAGVELDAVHCVTGSIYAIRERWGGSSGVWNLPPGLTLGWRIPVKYIHASEREGLFVRCYTKHSVTPLMDFVLPPPYEKRSPVWSCWGKMKRKAFATTFRSFWCLGSSHSIIKAAPLVKLFVQFPEHNSQTENL